MQGQDGLETPATWNSNLPALFTSRLLLSIYRLHIFPLLSLYDRKAFIVSHLAASTSGRTGIFLPNSDLEHPGEWL